MLQGQRVQWQAGQRKNWDKEKMIEKKMFPFQRVYLAIDGGKKNKDKKE